jgi:hypothetical protein
MPKFVDNKGLWRNSLMFKRLREQPRENPCLFARLTRMIPIHVTLLSLVKRFGRSVFEPAG